MCWAFRMADGGVDAQGADLSAPFVGRISRAGQDAAVLVRERGSMSWTTMRYGLTFAKSGGGRQMIWNARDDKVDVVESWARLSKLRFAVPVDAYVENAPDERWFAGPPAWLVGYYDPDRDGGAAVLTEDGPHGRMPVVVGADAAMEWLKADPWDALAVLRRAPRRRFDEADLFQAKRLEADARTRVPLRRAA